MIDIQFKKQSKGVEKELQSSAPQMMPHHSMISYQCTGLEQNRRVGFQFLSFVLILT
jgi:hypothetical protein